MMATRCANGRFFFQFAFSETQLFILFHENFPPSSKWLDGSRPEPRGSQRDPRAASTCL